MLKKYKKLFYIIIIILTLLIPVLFNQMIIQKYQRTENILEINNFYFNNKVDNLKFRKLNNKESVLYKFTTEIKGDNILDLGNNNYKLMVHRLVCDWYKIYFNGRLIGSLGNPEDTRSNIWNSFNLYDLDKENIKDINTLTIELSATFIMGFKGLPLSLTTAEPANNLLDLYNFLINNLYILTFGISVFCFLILLTLYYLSDTQKTEYLYFGLAALFMAVDIMDYLPIHHLYTSVIAFKKVTHLSVYLISIFSSLAVYKIYHNKLNLYHAYLLSFVGGVITIFFWQLPLFKTIFDFFYILLIINILVLIYTCINNLKDSYKARFITFISFYILIYSGHDIIMEWTTNSSVMYFHVFGILIYTIGLGFFLIIDFMHITNQFSYEQKRANLLYEKSIRDGMTGAYNHQFITGTLEQNNTPYTLIIMDLDDFKEINDTYGHQAGDTVLKKVAQRIKNNIRESDIFGRYGGDEFVLILYNCKLLKAEEIASKIKKDIEKPIEIHGQQNINITFSLGVTVSRSHENSEDVLRRADQALYQAKGQGKNMIVLKLI